MEQKVTRKLGFPQLLSRMRDTSYTITFSFSSSSSSSPSYPPFPWLASCSLPRTLSFRSAKEEVSSTTELPRQSNSSSTAAAAEAAAERKSFSSTASEGSDGDAVEAAIRRLRSVDRRLFFEPGSATSSSIVEAAVAASCGVPFEGTVAVAVESVDPYGDFRRSMEEMAGARSGGAAAAEWLEEMLRWYLRANAKKTHGVIVLAFMDLLSSLPLRPPPPSSSPSSSSSSATATSEAEEDEKM